MDENTMTVIVKGTQVLRKRMVKMKFAAPGELSFVNATALARRFAFLDELLRWQEANRNWKDGSYVQRE